MRRVIMAQRLYSDEATRHAQAFVDDIRTTGKLNEAFLPLKTLHFKLVKMLPLMVRMLVKGRIPPLRVKQVDKLASLQSIFDRFG